MADQDLKADVIRLWRTGLTSGMIADRLVAAHPAITRNVVIGIVTRAGQRGEDLGRPRPIETVSLKKVGQRRGKARPELQPEPAPEPVVAEAPAVSAARPEPEIEPAPPLPPARRPAEAVQGGAPRAVAALKATSCRWPIGDTRAEDFRFCCAPQHAEDPRGKGKPSPYCAEHHRLAYAPRPAAIAAARRTATPEAAHV